MNTLTSKQISGRNDYLKHKEAYLLRANKRRQLKPDEIKRSKARWYQRVKNTSAFIAKRRVRDKKYRSTTAGKISNNISCLIRNTITGRVKNGKHWEDIVGYSTKQLIIHLEAQFSKNMSWDNYGFNGWHIDHIKPICSFDVKSIEDQVFKDCWALNNLRPLWRDDNLIKSAKDKKLSINKSEEIDTEELSFE